MATEWDAFPVASSQSSGASEWDAFPIASSTPAAEKPLGLEYAPLDVGLALGTGTAASVYGGLKGLGTLVTGGGLDKAAQDVNQSAQEYTWQPRGRAGQAVVETLGDVMHGITKGVGKVTGGIGEMVGGEAGRDVGELVANVGVPSVLTVAGYKPTVRGANFTAEVGKAMFDQAKAAKAAKTASSAIERIQAEPGKIQALQQAKDLPYPLAVEPLSASNTAANRLLTAAADEPVLRSEIAKQNAPLWSANAKAQMGIEQNKILTPQVYDEYRASIAGPKNEITALQVITPDENVIQSLDGVRADYALLGKEQSAAAVNRLIDNAQQQIASGMSGRQVIDNIESLRQSARRTLSKKEVPAAEMDIADAQIAVSKALEDSIESHLSKTGAADLLSAYKDMRKKMAVSYAYESATDMNSNLIRPELLAKATKRENLAEGPAAAMGRIAGTMPEIVSDTGSPLSWQHLLRRSSIPGTLGAIAGGSMAGPAGAVIGGAAGAGLSQWVAGPLARRRALSESVQRGLRPDVVSLESPVTSLPRTIPINRDIPYSGLPPVPGSMVIPQSWRDGIQAAMEKRGLPVMAEDLLPHNAGGAVITPTARPAALPELPPIDPLGFPVLGPSAPQPLNSILRPLQDMDANPLPTAVGRAGTVGLETGLNLPDVPLPRTPKGGVTKTMDKKAAEAAKARANLLDIAYEQPVGKLSDIVETKPFDSRLDVLNSPIMVEATNAFIDEAGALKEAIAAETNGFKKSTLEAKLRGTENRFMAGLKEMGIRSEAEARNLMRKVYESGGETQRGVVKTKSLKDLMK